MSKEIKFGADARALIKKGIDKIANAVGSTLGPKGKNVLIAEMYGGPKITKDGITVAKSISFKNKYENLGAQFVKTGAQKTVDQAGDGTTATAILTQKIYNEGFQLLAGGWSQIDLKRGIDKAVECVVAKLNEMTVPTQDPAKIAQIGAISANDKEIGDLIAEAMAKVGKDGVITIEEGQTPETVLSVTEGMQFDRGYYSPYFVTNTEKVEAEYIDAFILLNDGRLEDINLILPLFQEVSKYGKPLLILAEDYGQALLQTLILNKVKGSLISCPVKAPGFGERRKEILKDLAVLTGGAVFSNESGLALKNAEVKHLGRAKRIIVNRATTTIVGGAGTKEEIVKRIAQIKDDIKHLDTPYDVRQAKDRLAKLTGGVAVIRVGGSTEPEMKEKKDRVEDAMHATKAAVEEGIVPGGGVALIRCKKVVQDLVDSMTDRGEREGAKLILQTLETPLRTIVQNAGGKPDIVVHTVEINENLNFGYNAATDVYEDLVEAGIIDPKKVVRTALQNAASVASMLLTTEAVIVDEDAQESEDD